MTIHYASDLHLEFPENRAWLKEHPLKGGGMLILAGDVVPFRELDRHIDQFARWNSQYDKVLWLPGNHEYYGGDIAKRSGRTDEKILPNVRLVNDIAVHAGNTRILCTTLWTRIGQLNEQTIRRGVNDYHQIRSGNDLLLPAQTTRLHLESLGWLKNELAKSFAGTTIVATHHVPTLMNYPPEYRGSTINEAFAVELHDMIAASGASAWIYGHHHRNIPTYTIGTTHMLTDQMGYILYGEEHGFDTDAHLNFP